ncbi:uncharacterized protein NDAI_0G01080 [Naumovozyma dairenensis CBS 421]|uniref:LYC1 C-terminal domain-containing protein n=1 Tax=Naumovozyma dairenensis (strain ATCC 10597 / BCRC 20456 / CBS 421 / NBRC 0211 / NRRL Y-12639) TaxID=1071378 RepID=G0WDM3_NAUDC|nr:hypothetical protein NDAI_0G01080 [Naumovozyma dairenensis CBS 421]CCD25884.2 hypothetical protein NDAI_0G01080 [Naumovozyma dairenensis CBS 421]
MSNTNSLIFEEYNDPELIGYSHSQNGEAWKGILSLEDYAAREWTLGQSSIAQKQKSPEIQEKFPDCYQNLGIKYFMLKDLNLEATSKTSQIVSSCETLNRIGYCIRPGTNNTIEPSLVVCIGGVFTPEMHRRNGYARVMIEKLNQHYDKIRDSPNAPPLLKNLVINLYSEVDEYYEKVGYYSLHVPLHHVTALDEFNEKFCNGYAMEQNDSGRLLGYDNYEDLVKLQDIEFKKNLLASAKAHPDSFVFTVAPDIDIYKWFEDRDIFIQRKITPNGSVKIPPFGYALKDNSHIIWHHNWNNNLLVIIKLYISEDAKKEKKKEEKVLRELMFYAIEETKAHNLTKLQFWDEELPLKEFPTLQNTLSKLEHESKLYATNGSVSAVRPPIGFNKDTIVWENNTKFCWF